MITEVLPSLSLIALGVAGIALLGRDRDDADQCEVADYRTALAPARRDWPLASSATVGRRRLRARAYANLVLPPTRRTENPLYVETACAMGVWPVDAGAVVAVVASQYGTDPADRADRMLRELGEQARAGMAAALGRAASGCHGAAAGARDGLMVLPDSPRPQPVAELDRNSFRWPANPMSAAPDRTRRNAALEMTCAR